MAHAKELTPVVDLDKEIIALEKRLEKENYIPTKRDMMILNIRKKLSETSPEDLEAGESPLTTAEFAFYYGMSRPRVDQISKDIITKARKRLTAKSIDPEYRKSLPASVRDRIKAGELIKAPIELPNEMMEDFNKLTELNEQSDEDYAKAGTLADYYHEVEEVGPITDEFVIEWAEKKGIDLGDKVEVIKKLANEIVGFKHEMNEAKIIQVGLFSDSPTGMGGPSKYVSIPERMKEELESGLEVMVKWIDDKGEKHLDTASDLIGKKFLLGNEQYTIHEMNEDEGTKMEMEVDKVLHNANVEGWNDIRLKKELIKIGCTPEHADNIVREFGWGFNEEKKEKKEVTCPVCKGYGHDLRDNPCTRCFGSGKVDDYIPKKKNEALGEIGEIEETNIPGQGGGIEGVEEKKIRKELTDKEKEIYDDIDCHPNYDADLDAIVDDEDKVCTKCGKGTDQETCPRCGASTMKASDQIDKTEHQFGDREEIEEDHVSKIKGFTSDYEGIANEVRLSSDKKSLYIKYMQQRWPKGEEVGYAKEWASRFQNNLEWTASDTTGKRTLMKLDPENYPPEEDSELMMDFRKLSGLNEEFQVGEEIDYHGREGKIIKRLPGGYSVLFQDIRKEEYIDEDELEAQNTPNEGVMKSLYTKRAYQGVEKQREPQLKPWFKKQLKSKPAYEKDKELDEDKKVKEVNIGDYTIKLYKPGVTDVYFEYGYRIYKGSTKVTDEFGFSSLEQAEKEAIRSISRGDLDEARTIGGHYKQQIRSLIQQAKNQGIENAHKITEYVKMNLPEEAFDTWEGAYSEVERLVWDYVTGAKKEMNEDKCTKCGKQVSPEQAQETSETSGIVCPKCAGDPIIKGRPDKKIKEGLDREQWDKVKNAAKDIAKNYYKITGVAGEDLINPEGQFHDDLVAKTLDSIEKYVEEKYLDVWNDAKMFEELLYSLDDEMMYRYGDKAMSKERIDEQTPTTPQTPGTDVAQPTAEPLPGLKPNDKCSINGIPLTDPISKYNGKAGIVVASDQGITTIRLDGGAGDIKFNRSEYLKKV